MSREGCSGSAWNGVEQGLPAFSYHFVKLFLPALYNGPLLINTDGYRIDQLSADDFGRRDGREKHLPEVFERVKTPPS